MNDWISVNDRLPEMGQTVIITDGKRSWLVGNYIGLLNDNPIERLWRNNKIMEVIYWMPKEGALPPVPQEEEKCD